LADLNEEDKWVANPAGRVLMRRSLGGGTTGMDSAKAVPASTGGRSMSGRLAATAVGTEGGRMETDGLSYLPVAADDIDRDPPWASLATVAGVVAGAALAALAWWRVWKVIDRAWARKAGGRG
jgi:hypothetical protein